MTLKIVHGGYRKGLWFHDRQAHTQEEIDFINETLREAGQHDPRWLKLIWEVDSDAQPELRPVK